jgi:hypothetical protein
MAAKGAFLTIEDPGESPVMLWFRDHKDYQHDCCLTWPFARLQSGYGQFGGRRIGAHRFMCELRNGPPPSPGHQAAHSCGRGSDGCVNPKHLSWKTNAENQLERYQHSGLVRGTKITLAQVVEIRALQGKQKTGETAKLYGTSETNVRDIQSGRTRSGPRQRRPFEAHEVLLIRSTPWQEKSAAQFATEFGCSRGIIERIRQGASYRWVTDASVIPSAQHS